MNSLQHIEAYLNQRVAFLNNRINSLVVSNHQQATCKVDKVSINEYGVLIGALSEMEKLKEELCTEWQEA